MPIKIRLDKQHGHCPIVICDHCQQQITKADEGAYVYNLVEDESGIKFAHKKVCLDHVQKKLNSDGWMELSVFPIYLARNLEINITGAEEQADALSA